MAEIVITVSERGRIVFGKKELTSLLGKAGREVAATARQLVARKLTKSQVSKGKTRGASLPGQPPMSRTQALRNGIKATVSRNGLRVRIQDKVPYALFLEVGAVGGGGKLGSGRKRVHRARNDPKQTPPTSQRVLLPRPFLSTALAMKRASIEKRMKETIETSVSWVPEK